MGFVFICWSATMFLRHADKCGFSTVNDLLTNSASTLFDEMQCSLNVFLPPKKAKDYELRNCESSFV